jgi:SMC interacting uncharacterized protein involved in chromosome segregation
LLVGLFDRLDDEKRVADQLVEQQARAQQFTERLQSSEKQLRTLRDLKAQLENDWRQQERSTESELRTLSYLRSKSREYDASLKTMKVACRRERVCVVDGLLRAALNGDGGGGGGGVVPKRESVCECVSVWGSV